MKISRMKILGGKDGLIQMLFNQLSSFWKDIDYDCIENAIDLALDRVEVNISELNLSFKYVRDADGKLCFSPYNTCEYCVFLYYLSNTLYKRGSEREASCVYWLNKIMNQVELFYAIDLPDHFGVEHPIGSVLGRAEYGDYLFFYQGVTIGGSAISSTDPEYPSIGTNVVFCGGSMALGNCHIGDNVVVGSGAIVKNQDVPANTVVFGESPNLIIKRRKENVHDLFLWGGVETLE